jgi:hypothetical protein
MARLKHPSNAGNSLYLFITIKCKRKYGMTLDSEYYIGAFLARCILRVIRDQEDEQMSLLFKIL